MIVHPRALNVLLSHGFHLILEDIDFCLSFVAMAAKFPVAESVLEKIYF